MFSMELVFKIAGREVDLDRFVGELLTRSLETVRSDIRALRVHEAPALQRSMSRPGTHQPPRAVGIDGAAELLSLSKHTIRKYVAEGKLRSVRVGRRILIPIDTLEQVLQEGLRLGR